MVTIREVAQKAGVGVGTVSRVSNDKGSVSSQTRARVLKAIQELNYAPNPVAQSLPRKKTIAVGVVVPLFTTQAFVEELKGVEDRAVRNRYDIVLYNIESRESRDRVLAKLPMRKKVDGLIIVSLPVTDQEVERIKSAELPCVLVNERHPDMNFVWVDDELGARKAVDYLLDLGHREVAIITEHFHHELNFPTGRERYEGYLKSMRDRGLEIRLDLVEKDELSKSGGYRAAKRLLKKGTEFSALFCASDDVALGAIEAIREEGLKVPEDISVIGFDNLERAEYTGLTTVSQPFFELGATAMDILLGLMQASETASLLPTQLVLDTELVVRKTCLSKR